MVYEVLCVVCGAGSLQAPRTSEAMQLKSSPASKKTVSCSQSQGGSSVAAPVVSTVEPQSLSSPSGSQSSTSSSQESDEVFVTKPQPPPALFPSKLPNPTKSLPQFLLVEGNMSPEEQSSTQDAESVISTSTGTSSDKNAIVPVESTCGAMGVGSDISSEPLTFHTDFDNECNTAVSSDEELRDFEVPASDSPKLGSKLLDVNANIGNKKSTSSRRELEDSEMASGLQRFKGFSDQQKMIKELIYNSQHLPVVTSTVVVNMVLSSVVTKPEDQNSTAVEPDAANHSQENSECDMSISDEASNQEAPSVALPDVAEDRKSQQQEKLDGLTEVTSPNHANDAKKGDEADQVSSSEGGTQTVQKRSKSPVSEKSELHSKNKKRGRSRSSEQKRRRSRSGDRKKNRSRSNDRSNDRSGRQSGTASVTKSPDNSPQRDSGRQKDRKRSRSSSRSRRRRSSSREHRSRTSRKSPSRSSRRREHSRSRSRETRRRRSGSRSKDPRRRSRSADRSRRKRKSRSRDRSRRSVVESHRNARDEDAERSDDRSARQVDHALASSSKNLHDSPRRRSRSPSRSEKTVSKRHEKALDEKNESRSPSRSERAVTNIDEIASDEKPESRSPSRSERAVLKRDESPRQQKRDDNSPRRQSRSPPQSERSLSKRDESPRQRKRDDDSPRRRSRSPSRSEKAVSKGDESPRQRKRDNDSPRRRSRSPPRSEKAVSKGDERNEKYGNSNADRAASRRQADSGRSSADLGQQQRSREEDAADNNRIAVISSSSGTNRRQRHEEFEPDEEPPPDLPTAYDPSEPTEDNFRDDRKVLDRCRMPPRWIPPANQRMPMVDMSRPPPGFPARLPAPPVARFPPRPPQEGVTLDVQSRPPNHFGVPPDGGRPQPPPMMNMPPPRPRPAEVQPPLPYSWPVLTTPAGVIPQPPSVQHVRIPRGVNVDTVPLLVRGPIEPTRLFFVPPGVGQPVRLAEATSLVGLQRIVCPPAQRTVADLVRLPLGQPQARPGTLLPAPPFVSGNQMMIRPAPVIFQQVPEQSQQSMPQIITNLPVSQIPRMSEANQPLVSNMPEISFPMSGGQPPLQNKPVTPGRLSQPQSAPALSSSSASSPSSGSQDAEDMLLERYSAKPEPPQSLFPSQKAPEPPKPVVDTQKKSPDQMSEESEKSSDRSQPSQPLPVPDLKTVVTTSSMTVPTCASDSLPSDPRLLVQFLLRQTRQSDGNVPPAGDKVALVRPSASQELSNKSENSPAIAESSPGKIDLSKTAYSPSQADYLGEEDEIHNSEDIREVKVCLHLYLAQQNNNTQPFIQNCPVEPTPELSEILTHRCSQITQKHSQPSLSGLPIYL